MTGDCINRLPDLNAAQKKRVYGSRTVSAKEVLRRVQIADSKRATITKGQVIRERVHVRKTTHGQNHPQLASVDTWKSPTAIYWNVNDDGSPAGDLKAQYQAHGISASLPLSASSVDAWGMSYRCILSC